jgi:acyl-CoA thioester hydrolase
MAALLETYRTDVLPEWIDYNGHMNVAYYVLVFDRGTDGLLDRLGLGEAYRRSSNFTLYALEAHVSYLREVRVGDPLVVTTQLVAGDAKRLHFFHFMHHAEAGYLAATEELMTLHVDLTGPRAAPIPAAEAARVAALLEEHRALPAPPQLGRSIRMHK